MSSFIAGHSFSEFWASLCKATYSTRERNSCCDQVLFLLLFFGGLFCGVHFRGDQLIFLFLIQAITISKMQRISWKIKNYPFWPNMHSLLKFYTVRADRTFRLLLHGAGGYSTFWQYLLLYYDLLIYRFKDMSKVWTRFPLS